MPLMNTRGGNSLTRGGGGPGGGRGGGMVTGGNGNRADARGLGSISTHTGGSDNRANPGVSALGRKEYDKQGKTRTDAWIEKYGFGGGSRGGGGAEPTKKMKYSKTGVKWGKTGSYYVDKYNDFWFGSTLNSGEAGDNYNGGHHKYQFDYSENLKREKARVKAATLASAENPTTKAPPSRRKGTVLSAMNSNKK